MNVPDDYTVRLIDMPTVVGGTINESLDGHINIYINARLSHDGQHKAFDHEIKHWQNDDFHNDDDIRVVEARASGKESRLKAIPKLMKARDLLPKPRSVPRPRPTTISPYQFAMVKNAVSELDKVFFAPDIYEY